MICVNSTKLSELIGIIIGDGNIYYNAKLNKYYFEITGDPLREREYFNHISKLINDILAKKLFPRIGGRGLRLRVYSKEFVEFLINELGIPYGKNKGKLVRIPEEIISKDWNLIKSCIRGITDTDGSLFLSKKGNRENYPTVEITTTSKPLANQLRGLLNEKYRLGFRSFTPKGFRKKFVISVNGNEMVNKWINDIGFSNKRKLRKYGIAVI
jgi:hypothetical protein